MTIFGSKFGSKKSNWHLIFFGLNIDKFGFLIFFSSFDTYNIFWGSHDNCAKATYWLAWVRVWAKTKWPKRDTPFGGHEIWPKWGSPRNRWPFWFPRLNKKLKFDNQGPKGPKLRKSIYIEVIYCKKGQKKKLKKFQKVLKYGQTYW